ncbi:MAG: hypothetical protein AB7I48_03735 [Planctomycetaceae bacterium]
MIRNETYPAAHRAIHRLVIQGRAMGYENEPPAKIAKLLDEVEYLIGMLYDDQESTELFADYLKGITDDFGWRGIHEEFIVATEATVVTNVETHSR